MDCEKTKMIHDGDEICKIDKIERDVTAFVFCLFAIYEGTSEKICYVFEWSAKYFQKVAVESTGIQFFPVEYRNVVGLTS